MAKPQHHWPEDEDAEPLDEPLGFSTSSWLRVFFFTWIAFAVGLVFPVMIGADSTADGAELPSGIGGVFQTFFISLVLTSVGAVLILLPLFAIATWTSRHFYNQVVRLGSFAVAAAVGVLLTLVVLRMAFWTSAASIALLLPVAVAPVVRWFTEREPTEPEPTEP